MQVPSYREREEGEGERERKREREKERMRETDLSYIWHCMYVWKSVRMGEKDKLRKALGQKRDRER